MEQCLFCKIASGKIPSDKVFEDSDLFAFRDINPQAPSHIVVVPKKHIATINDMAEGDSCLFGKVMLAIKKIAAKEGISSGGYRVVINCNSDAGQTVFHVHFHLLGGRKLQWPPG